MSDFLRLYQYGEGREKILLVLGIFVGLASGITIPIFIYFWGK
jgi:hypothetical protein